MPDSDHDAAVRAFWLAQAGPPLDDDSTPTRGRFYGDQVARVWGVGLHGVSIEEWNGDGIYRVRGASLLSTPGESFEAATLEEAEAWVETIYKPERARIDAQIRQWIAEAKKAAKRKQAKEKE